MENNDLDPKPVKTMTGAKGAASLLFGSLLVVLMVVKGVDLVLSQTVNPKLNYQWLLFEPGIEVHYRSTEFDVMSKINRLGFRDREFSLEKSAQYRIVALGDSFTYGWGVSLEESWPKRLEALFREDGMDVEVLNLGRPGGSPYIFSETSKIAIPLLKPDLVLTAILQGEDLAACYPGTGPRTNAEIVLKDKSRIVGAIRRFFPNILQLSDMKFRVPYRLMNDEIIEVNKGVARDFDATMNPDERKRFNGLDDELKTLFFSGMISPHIVVAAVKYPDSFLPTMEPGTPQLQSRIDILSGFLETIERNASAHQANVLVLSVPFPCFMTEENRNQTSRIGYNTTPSMCGSPLPDAAVKEAAEAAKLPFFEVSEKFREECGKRQLFFPLDLHLNADGQQTYSELIYPAVKEFLLEQSLTGSKIP